MNGQIMYELAKQRADERVRAAARAADARTARRAAAHGRHAAEAAAATPAIPDFAHEMFGDAVPPPRRESGDGRHARSAG
jgi:hypothetical protein